MPGVLENRYCEALAAHSRVQSENDLLRLAFIELVMCVFGFLRCT